MKTLNKWVALGCLLTVGLLMSAWSVNAAEVAKPAAAAAAVEPSNWYTGDMHVHRSCGGTPIAISDMYQKLFPQNLTFMSLLADSGDGEVQDPVQDLPRVNGLDDPISTSGKIVHWDAENHWDPVGVSYPQKNLGDHIVTLGINDAYQIYPEYSYPIINWAHQQNGIAGFAHFQYLDNNIPQTLSCCTPVEYPVEIALGTADFISEDDFGSDSFIQAYYRLLNDGFRPGFAAGTDYPCNNPNVGSLLTYVKIGGTPTYRNWINGIAKGNTVVSRNGHNEFLDLKVNNVAGPGDEINLTGPGNVQATVVWTANQKLSGTIELVNNGVVIASQPVTSSSSGSLSATVNFSKSGWLAARRMNTNGEHNVATGAVFVTVNNSPVRASVTDAQFYVQWMDNLLQKTSPGGPWNSYFQNNLSDAQARYKAAKVIYQQIALEAGQGGGGGGTGQICPCSIWSTNTIPGVTTDSDTSATELGVRFRSDVNGNITGIRFYKGSTNTGTHVGSLWTNTGTLLGRVTFSGETSSGWQQANFATPIPITTGNTYVASYHTNVGHYSEDDNYFATSGVDNAPLHALQDGIDGINGAYTYNANPAFPTNPWQSANYYVDVVFTNNSGTPTPTPTPTITPTPTPTITPTPTPTITPTPTPTITPTPTPTITPTPTPTITPTPTMTSIWSSSAIPGRITENDAAAVELGVKFRSDINGSITGIRFYKGPSNTGTHVGSLWTSKGALLGQVTFSGETSSGWQQANFSNPVNITAGTTYIASYHTNIGYYSEDDNYFVSSGVDNVPLHALQNGVDGGNGVYAYNSKPTFPTNSYISSNYWVDVVFNGG